MNNISSIKSLVILFILFLFGITSSHSQNCNCNHTVSLNHGYLVDGLLMGIKPGDTVCLETGTRSNLLLRNIFGNKEQPVVITNCGGKTTISSNTSSGVEIRSSKYVKITGTGSADNYGIEISGSNTGLCIGYLSTNIEIEHLQIHDVEFAGIMAKTDPNCKDPLTWGKKYTMYDLNVHHNEIYNTIGGEGFYIGYSNFDNGIQCGANTVFPHAIINAKIHHNYIHDTGAEGIQVGAATEGCEIYNNRIINYGQGPFNNESDQTNGIQLGSGTGGLCYNNFIKAGNIKKGANGIILTGIGNNIVFNNIIINSGENGIFMDDRPSSKTGHGSYFKIINNTIISPAKDGIKTYAEHIEYNEIKNNIIIIPGSGKYINNKGGPGIPVVRDSNNLKVKSISEVKFTDPNSDNYQLTSLSPARNTGINVSMCNILFDIHGYARPGGSGFDRGACEFHPDKANISPSIKLSKQLDIDLPVDSLKISAIVNDLDGKIDSILWEKLEGPEATLSQINKSELVIKNIMRGSFRFKITVKDNGNASTSEEIDLIVK